MPPHEPEGAAAPLGVDQIELSSAPAPGQGSAWARRAAQVGLGLALGLTALTGLAPAVMAESGWRPEIPEAQVALVPAQVQSSLVQVQNVSQVVERFRPEQQLYVVGQPKFRDQALGSADYSKLQRVLQQHPHAYVVLVAESDNVKEDDYTLARGIGNHPGFTSRLEQRTGQPDGAVYMVYFKVTDQNFISRTGKERAMYMRSEDLLDQAGVGEANFVDRETLENRELFQTYIDAIASGSDVPEAMGSVLQRVEQGVDSYVETYVQGAQTQLGQAQSRLNQISSQVSQFQSRHGKKGELGLPDVAGWRQQVQSAQKQVQQKQYAQALETLGSLEQSLTRYQQTVTDFEQAPARAQQLQQSLAQAEKQLAQLENNGPAVAARGQIQQAKAALAAYQAAYQSNSSQVAEPLERAETLTQGAAGSIRSSQRQTQRVRALKLYGSGALAAAGLVTAGILAYRARQGKEQANALFEQKSQLLQQRSQALIEIMNAQDFDEVAQYQGQTQQLAQQLIEGTAQALTLMGGGSKILAEAKDLIEGNTPGRRLQNLFLTGNYDQAQELLTHSEQRREFSLSDAFRVQLPPGSGAENWREQLLGQVAPKTQQACLREILEWMQRSAQGNQSLVATIQTKSQEVDDFLGGIGDRAGQLQQDSLSLQEQGQADRLFVAPSVTTSLLPRIEALLQQGEQVKRLDPVRAWDEFGSQAQQLTQVGNQIVGLGGQARQDLLPVVEQADLALLPQQVHTDWAHARKDQDSFRLDQAGHKALEEPVAQELEALQGDIAELQIRLKTIMEQDQQRREVAPLLIQAAEAEVQGARQGLGQALQLDPDRVLREPERDPSQRTRQAREDLAAIKPRLDTGASEEAGQLLAHLGDQVGQARQLVADTREAFQAYPPTAQERAHRRQQLQTDSLEIYAPALERIQAGYLPQAQAQVAAEVHPPGGAAVKTVSDYLDHAQQQLEQSGVLNSQAQGNYHQAYLLTSRDQLQQSDLQLQGARTHLESIVNSETTLAQHQQEAQQGLQALQERLTATTQRVQQDFVRRPAQEISQQTQQQLPQVIGQVRAQPADPYGAQQALEKLEHQRQKVESAIAADLSALKSAQSALSSAEADIRQADSKIRSVENKSWSSYVSDYGSVSHSVSSSDLSGARSRLSQARSTLGGAQSQLGSKSYEESQSQAEQASQQADSAAREADQVEDREYSHYRSKLSSAEAQAASVRRGREERERREREERERREREERERQNNSGGGGGGGGGGSSGSTGGGW